MKELIRVEFSNIGEESIQTVSARELHAFLGVKSRFNDWIKNRIENYEFEEGVDFISLTENLVRGGTIVEYHITIDMAKELAMVERNDKGREARKYFIECERQLKTGGFQIPQNLPDALRLAADLGDQVAQQKQLLEEQQPKVDFVEKFVNADGLYGLQNAARAIGCSPNKFIQWLKQKYMFYQGAALVPRVQYIHMGVFEVKNTVVDDKARPRSYITPKGIEYFTKRVPDGLRLAGVA